MDACRGSEQSVCLADCSSCNAPPNSHCMAFSLMKCCLIYKNIEYLHPFSSTPGHISVAVLHVHH